MRAASWLGGRALNAESDGARTVNGPLPRSDPMSPASAMPRENTDNPSRSSITDTRSRPVSGTSARNESPVAALSLLSASPDEHAASTSVETSAVRSERVRMVREQGSRFERCNGRGEVQATESRGGSQVNPALPAPPAALHWQTWPVLHEACSRMTLPHRDRNLPPFPGNARVAPPAAARRYRPVPGRGWKQRQSHPR